MSCSLFCSSPEEITNVSYCMLSSLFEKIIRVPCCLSSGALIEMICVSYCLFSSPLEKAIRVPFVCLVVC